MRGEIEIARYQAASHSLPHILQVRVAVDGPLPYPLNVYLDGIQYADWQGPVDTARLLRELLAVVSGGPPVDARQPTPGPVPEQAPLPPLYAAQLPVPGGTLDIDDPWYLPRPTDDTALGVARQPGQTLTIKGPRQMGRARC